VPKPIKLLEGIGIGALMNTFIRQSGRKDSKKDIYTAIKKKN